MGWIAINVGLVLVSLFAGWIVVKIFMTEDGERKTGSLIVFLLVFAGVGALGRNTVIPFYETKMALRKINEAFAENPALAALQRHDSSNYQKLVEPLKQGVVDRKPLSDIKNEMQSTMIGIIKQKLPQASDAATVKYVSMLSEIVTKVVDRNPSDCYELMRPSSASTQVLLSKYVSPQEEKALAEAMADVISSSSIAPQHVPLESEVKSMIEPMIEELIRLYGRDVLMLMPASSRSMAQSSGFARPPTPDKGRICQMEAASLRLALRNPPAEAGKLLRHLMSLK